MPSKEMLQSRVDEATRAYNAAAEEETKARSALTSTKEVMAALEQRYEVACVAAAKGEKAEDPASLQAERDSHGHRLRGLEKLHKAALDAAAGAAEKLRAASSALQAELDREELQRLESAVKDSLAKVEAARSALQDAERENRVAAGHRDSFLHKITPSGRELALRAQGRA
jgi:hypothetical protein